MTTTADVSRRQDLAAFLRARRNATRPEDVGLEREPGRHVPGLRREEVAALAGISTTWYTWIEQGREITVSPEALVQIARALNLTPRMVEYMSFLSRTTEPAVLDPSPVIPDAMRTLVQGHKESPAYVATARFDLLVWNDFVGEMFDYKPTKDPFELNVVWRFFHDPTRRRLYLDWEKAARMFVANFRHAFARYRDDPHFEDLLERLMRSEDFARLWERWDVLAPDENSAFMVRDRRRGVCELTPVHANLDTASGCYLAVFSCNQRS